jgi:hypothetical protein
MSKWDSNTNPDAFVVDVHTAQSALTDRRNAMLSPFVSRNPNFMLGVKSQSAVALGPLV